jgi:hypothetical protein
MNPVYVEIRVSISTTKYDHSNAAEMSIALPASMIESFKAQSLQDSLWGAAVINWKNQERRERTLPLNENNESNESNESNE